MWRIILALALALASLCSSGASATAQGPITNTVHLPFITKGTDMPQWAMLELTDGTTTVNLLQSGGYGFHLDSWNPSVPQMKGGGVWQDSPLSEGRRLIDGKFGNVVDSMDFDVNGRGQAQTIAESVKLIQLLEKAREFGTSNWQTDPVWFVRRLACEDNVQYALIYDYKISSLANPYAAPFFSADEIATMENFVLGTEHSIWMGNQPGTGTCIQSGNLQSWIYTPGWVVNWHTPLASSVFALLQAANGDIYTSVNNDIYRSQDNGINWVLNSALPGSSVTSFLQTANGYIYAGDNGDILWTQDNGLNWAVCTAVPTNIVGAMIQLKNGDILAGEYGQVWRSQDNGASWAVLTTVPIGFVYSILEADNGDIYIGEQWQVWKSSDGGMTWSIVLSDIGDYAFSVFQSASGAIFVGELGKIHVSRDNGATWGIAFSGVSDRIYDIIQATNGTLYAGDRTYIWASLDDGITWFASSTLPIGQVQCLLQAADGSLYAGEDEHILKDISQIDTMTMGNAALCGDATFISNKHNVANLTHIFVNDGGVFGANLLPMTAFPVSLLPAAPAIGDYIAFGIDTTAVGSGPFESLIFDLRDIITFTTTYTIAWEYSDGAAGWPALTAHDGTNPGIGAFRNPDIGSVHWEPPADWATEAVNGITGYWVRARVSALIGAMTAPSQQNRNIYTAVLPYADIAAAQVIGDIPALAQFKFNNRSDADGRGGAAPNLYDNRLIVGLRSYDRGPQFTAFLNASDEQNPPGVTVTVGANTAIAANVAGITGRLATYTGDGAATWSDEVTFELGPTIARDFYGSFHAFVRAKLDGGGASSDIHARLQVRTGSGGVMLTTDDDYLKGTDDFEVLDLGRITIPASGVLSFSDLGDSTLLVVQMRDDSGGGGDNLIHDLVLIPVDEWQMDATDYANATNSIVGRQSSTPHLLDIDSLLYRKIDVRTLVRTADGNGFVSSIYLPNSPGPAILQANAHQRLWALAMQTSATGAAYIWLAPPWIAHSFQAWANPRFVGFRGHR